MHKQLSHCFLSGEARRESGGEGGKAIAKSLIYKRRMAEKETPFNKDRCAASSGAR